MFYTLDWIIIGLYCIGIISLATYVSRKKAGSERSAEDYFLAGRSLPWWAIGASLIAANISAEQIIGMSTKKMTELNLLSYQIFVLKIVALYIFSFPRKVVRKI